MTQSTQKAIELCTSKVTMKMKHPEKISPHVSADLLSLMKKKDRLKFKLKRKPTSETIKRNYEETCDEYKRLNDKLYTQNLNEKLSIGDIKSKWKGLNEICGRNKKNSDEVKELMGENGTLCVTPREIANKFNDSFTTVNDSPSLAFLTPLAHKIYQSSQKSLFLMRTDITEVEEIIIGLKSNSAADPDKISPRVAQKLRPCLAQILVHLINLIFAVGKFPLCFKNAIVRPVFKESTKNDPLNYRPISMLNIFAKITEKIIYNRILSFLENNQFFYECQYGFRRKSGTENAAQDVVSYIRDGLNKSKKVSAVFLDLKKAFDLVDHKVLLSVCEEIGIRGLPLKLIKNYFTNRTQAVRVNGTTSDNRPINSGVVQGSVLGSLFLLIMINAIGFLKLSGRLVLYADDAVLLHTHERKGKIDEIIKNDMAEILQFFQMRKLTLNQKKTVFMVFQTANLPVTVPNEILINNDCKIARVDHFKYLGLHLDQHLKFDHHTGNIEKKITGAVGILWKIGAKIPLHSRKLIYSSLIHSHLQFMCGIWGSSCHTVIDSLQTHQNRALRNVHRLNRLHNRAEIYRTYSVLHIRALCIHKIVDFVYQCQKGLTLTSLNFPSQSNNTRSKGLLRKSKPRNNHGKRNISWIGPHLYNSLPPDIKNCQSKYRFASKVKEFLPPPT